MQLALSHRKSAEIAERSLPVILFRRLPFFPRAADETTRL